MPLFRRQITLALVAFAIKLCQKFPLFLLGQWIGSAHGELQMQKGRNLSEPTLKTLDATCHRKYGGFAESLQVLS
jgi:hypothetical protein